MASEELILESKDLRLGKLLKKLKKVLIAFSGGVDSTFLLFRALKELGPDKVTAVIIDGETMPARETEQALELARDLDTEVLRLKIDQLTDPRFILNNKDRCYFCKTGLFQKLKKVASQRNIEYILDGTNLDDQKDYRPGIKALKELGIKSPLTEVELKKDEIRQLAKESSLPNWNKPSMACLASRIPFNQEINLDKLKKIEAAEEFLEKNGFQQFRVRYHQEIARIEVSPKDFSNLLQIREKLILQFKELGFDYITLDLQGYQSGSLNLTAYGN